MTANRDVDRQLGTWFEARATSIPPDGLLARSLARVEATRQRPGWLVKDGWRSAGPSLGPVVVPAWAILLLVALAAVAVVATGARLSVTPPPAIIDDSSPSPSLSAAPSVTASPAPSAAPLPAELRYIWIGATRKVAQIAPPITESAVELTIARMLFHGGSDPILLSAANLVAADTLNFRLSQDGAGCHVGDVGTYTFTLNANAKALSIDAVADPCLARAAAISGEWVRTNCANGGSCLGDLDPGQHVSAAFNPFVPRATFRYEYGRLSYSVPEGWSNQVDGPDGYFLSKQGAPKDSGIDLFSTALADSQAIGCPGTIEPGVGHTSSTLATWLTKLPGLATTKPARVAIGGLSGFTLDVSVKPTWTRTCPYSNGKPYVAMFTNGDSTNNFDWGLTAGGRMRLFLLDLPDGRTMLIDVEAQDKATWDALVTDAMPVIQSFQFNP